MPRIVVTAASFIKSPSLCLELERQFSGSDTEVRFIPLAEKMTKDQLRHAISGAEGWIIGREICDQKLLTGLDELRVIAKYGVGLDNIDLDFCRQRGIKVVWEPGVNRDAVAEHTIGLMIGLMRNIAKNFRLLSGGVWQKDGGVSLSTSKVGIVGLGKIGSKVAQILRCLGSEVVYFDIEDRDAQARDLGLRSVSFDQLLRESNCISFHVPLTASTRHMLNQNNLPLIMPGSYIVNTSRGAVIDQETIKYGLNSKHLAGVALDVFEEEPLKDSELFQHENFLGTPHTAGNSIQAVLAMGRAAIRGLHVELMSKNLV